MWSPLFLAKIAFAEFVEICTGSPPLLNILLDLFKQKLYILDMEHSSSNKVAWMLHNIYLNYLHVFVEVSEDYFFDFFIETSIAMYLHLTFFLGGHNWKLDIHKRALPEKKVNLDSTPNKTANKFFVFNFFCNSSPSNNSLPHPFTLNFQQWKVKLFYIWFLFLL